jgi:hypothetical protein
LDARSCANEVVFPELKLHKPLPVNETVVVDCPPDHRANCTSHAWLFAVHLIAVEGLLDACPAEDSISPAWSAAHPSWSVGLDHLEAALDGLEFRSAESNRTFITALRCTLRCT